VGKGFTIAISGKGGVGKTVVAAYLIKRFSQQGNVLAIDADPDSNLAQALGVPTGKTVSEVRDIVSDASPRSKIGKAKQQQFEKSLNEAIGEFSQFDLVSMGYSEGPGCYCPHNYVIRRVIDSRAGSYDFTVIDCHAGLEHLNRKTTRDVDLMLVVSDPTVKGITTVKRVQELSKKLLIKFGEILVVVNKITPEAKPFLEKAARENGVDITAYIPFDPAIGQLDVLGEPISELSPDSPFSSAMEEIYQKILAKLKSEDHLGGRSAGLSKAGRSGAEAN
jgi:CO dehydrogenase maturation factor